MTTRTLERERSRRDHPSTRRSSTRRQPAGRRQARGTPAPRPRKRARRTTPVGYLLLIGWLCVINLVGLVMVLSASSVSAQRSFGNPWYFFERQVLWLALGAVALVTFARLDYRRLRPLSVPLVVLSMLLLFAVLVPGVGIAANGSTRWLGVGSWRVQPSELAKLGLVLFAADLLTRRADRMQDVSST